MPDEPWTVLKLINWTKAYFARGGVDDARLAAEVLLAHVLNCRRIELYARFDYQPTPDELAAFRALVARAKDHEPVAYLVGQREFYSLRFKVTHDVLIPRPETELVVSEAIAHLKSLERPGRVWDVGTGCGAIAVAVAHQVKDARVLATDISPQAVEIARENAHTHGVSDRVTCASADVLELPDGAAGFETVDVVASNPPYVGTSQAVADEVRHEPDVALYGGADGLDTVRRLIDQSAGRLAPGGRFIMEFGLGQADSVFELINAIGAFHVPTILNDQQDLERVIVATAR